MANAPFPPASAALEEPDGLLAWGGDLSPERLLNAYTQGIFPWYSGSEPILWWCPAERCVIPTDRVHVSRRLARVLRSDRFQFSADTAFSAVVDGCADRPDDTWINPAMSRAYEQLHQMGWAHSIEAWEDGELAGGLYGIALGRMFFGESMFSARPEASKAVLARLGRVLNRWKFPLIDAQVANPHLFRMGAKMIPRDDFLTEIARLVQLGEGAGSWTSSFARAINHG